MRRWKVMQGRRLRYDFWGVWVDNGSLFDANGKKRLPVHQVQRSFQAPGWVALADDLRRSAPSTLWTVEAEASSEEEARPEAENHTPLAVTQGVKRSAVLVDTEPAVSLEC